MMAQSNVRPCVLPRKTSPLVARRFYVGTPSAWCWQQPTGMKAPFTRQIGWTSCAKTISTWALAWVFTIAWVRRWPAWKDGSPSVRCCVASPGCVWPCPPIACAGTQTRSSAVPVTCQSHRLDPPPTEQLQNRERPRSCRRNQGPSALRLTAHCLRDYYVGGAEMLQTASCLEWTTVPIQGLGHPMLY